MDKNLEDFANAVALLVPEGHKPMIRYQGLVPYVGFVKIEPTPEPSQEES